MATLSLENLDHCITEFNRRIDKSRSNKCWIWLGHRGGPKRDIPFLSWKGKTIPALKVSVYLMLGVINNSMLIGKTCNNRLCVNPSHLYNRREFKRCHVCKKVLPIAEFSFRSDGRNPRGACKECSRGMRRKHYNLNKDAARRANRKMRLKRYYGMTVNDYDLLLNS